MFISHPICLRSARALCLSLAFVLFCLFSPISASAQNTSAPPSRLSMEIQAAFDRSYKDSLWAPVTVTVHNTGAEFKGKILAKVFTGPQRLQIIGVVSPWTFEQAVTIPAGSQAKPATKQVTITIPFSMGNFTPRGVSVELRDEQGKLMLTVNGPQVGSGYSLSEVQAGDLFIGYLANKDEAEFDTLERLENSNRNNLPNQGGFLSSARFDATTFPANATVLSNFDMLILDDFQTSTLSPIQIEALQTWVNQGGVLVEVGGPQWQSTLSPLPPDLLPVSVSGTAYLPAGTTIVPVSSPSSLPPSSPAFKPEHYDTKNPEPFLISTAAVKTHTSSFYDVETVLGSNTAPLIVQARQGQGVICYVAFDPASSPVKDWSSIKPIWRSLLFHTLGDRFLIPSIVPGYESGPGQILTRGGILSMMQPEKLIGPWIMLVLLIGYLLVLGPVRFWIVRKQQRPYQWSWRIFAASVVIFSLLSYGLAFSQRSASLRDNRLSLIQINQGSSYAHVTTYMGIFVPNQGDFTVRLPAQSLVEPVTNQLLMNTHSPNTTTDEEATRITFEPDATVVKRQVRNSWSFHSMVSEQDRQLQGGLVPHLTIKNQRVLGTITNSMDTSLSDVYVLLPHAFVPIGKIGAGETLQVNMKIQEAPLWGGKPLADQIATQGGLSAPYFPYIQNQLPQNDFQRHMALLAALNGTGFSFSPCNGACTTHAISTRNNMFITGGKTPNGNIPSNLDPLVLSNAPATLIGWADQDIAGINDISVNGYNPPGLHDTLIRMPLSIELASSSYIPADFIKGRIIDIQSSDAQAMLPGIYTMTTGNVVFSFNAPDSMALHSLTITEPDLLAHPFGPGSGGSLAVSHIQAQLYNWQTLSWDSITLQRDTFTTTHISEYVGPSGQILMEISGQKNYKGKLFFRQPTLSFV